jgi:hypothetical protein
MIKAIVDRENAAAVSAARIWTGRLVQERRITHILVITDSPDQDRGINRRLDAVLKRLKAEYFLTKPMTVPGQLEIPAAPDPSSNSGHGILQEHPTIA